MKNKLMLSLILGIFLISIVSASLDTLTPATLNKEYTVLQTCSDATWINLTISNTNGIILFNKEMNFNGTVWEYKFTPDTLGRHDVNYLTDGCEKSNTAYFIVNTSGHILDSSQSWVLIGSLVIMIIIALVFLFIANNSENTTSKIVFYSLSGIIFIVSILYTVVMMQQTLSEFTNILDGIETFWFIIKILIGIGIFVLLIIVVLILFKAWKIKRGYQDE